MDKDGESAQNMFLGTYKLYFSGRNRIILPKKFRREFGVEDKFYIFLGDNGELWGFSSEQWLKEAEKRLLIPLSEQQGVIERRKFFSQSAECILDAQGRFIIPQELIEYTSVKEEILLVGAGDHFEIWDPKKWNQITKI